MSSSTLQAEVFITETNDGKASTGYLEMISSENLLIDEIQCEIHFEARGRMCSYENTIVSFPVILQPKLLKAHEETIVPFTFMLNDAIESYEGTNVNFRYNCEVSIEVSREDYNKLGLSFLSNIKSLITSNRTLRTIKKFDVTDVKNTYKVEEGTFGFKLTPNYLISVIVAVLLFLVYLLFMPEFNGFYIFLGVAAIVVISIGIHSYLKTTLGKVTMKISDADEGFVCAVGKTKKFNLKEQTIYYEIVEKVRDQRGTKTATHTEVVYTSERKAMNNFRKSSEFKFLYVNNPNYKSMEIEDVTILWRMIITGTSNLGLKLKYTCKFTVNKDKLINNKDGLVTYF
jgi:hypothetical protein